MATKKTDTESKAATKEKAAARSHPKQTNPRNNVSKRDGKCLKFSGLDHPTVKSGDIAPEDKPLTAKQQRFVDEYLTDLNATQAAIRTGYSAKTANVVASQLLTKPNIAKAIQAGRDAMQKRTEITQDMVLRRWWEIATANPNELVSYRRVCCRNCFGKDHGYQWVDEDEWAGAVRMAKVMAGDKPVELPDNSGGYGFDKTLRPHPKCPVCHGEGNGEVFAHDTRDASESARALYAGVKQTKDGMEIKMRDQDAALVNIARHLGMFKDSLKLQGDEDNPLRVLMSQLQGTPLRPKDSDE